MKEKIIYALGCFDGVHTGHRALLNACRELAAARGCKCGAVTFSGHPDALLQGKPPALIQTPECRTRLLRENGMDTVLQLPFDEKMKNTPWQVFLEDLIRENSAAGFVCGTDFRFGKGGQGTADQLEDFCRKKGFAFAAVEQQYIDGIRVSSTHIRGLLQQGKMEQAAAFLGESFALSGKVVRGQQLGRTIGFPTANISYPAELVKLPFGVYACRCRIDGKICKAVTNIGSRPTVAGAGVTVESHILDFSADLYGKEIVLELIKFLRPEKKFENVKALTEQIQKDAQNVREMD